MSRAGFTRPRGCAIVAALSFAWGLAFALPASAAIPASLSSAVNCVADNSSPEAYVFCDDGVPGQGGTTPNVGGVKAVTVPAKYGGDGVIGLPLKSPDAATMAGADASGDIALDVDVSIPSAPPQSGGYPLVVLMHGCCAGKKSDWEAQSVAAGSRFDAGGERWHYNNAWFASRGYVVINYTARGFVTGIPAQGSTGETQLDSRRFEINDFQSLACQMLAQASDFSPAAGHAVSIDPDGVVVTGGSYGGGFSWLALTDPKWTCNADSGAAGTGMGLAAAAPKYGWTDLADSLVPTGYQSASPADLPLTNGCDSGPTMLSGGSCPDPAPIGIPKKSIDSVLYASGSGLPPSGNRTTFPASIAQAFACLSGTYPIEQNPACATVFAPTLQEFLNDRSAYYQNQFFSSLESSPGYRVPLFDAATFTDPLFPPIENRRMINRLLAVDPDYPVQAYYGDYQHFTQNKAKIWGDVCDSGGDRHVCTSADFAGDFNADPASLRRLGVTTRLNRFIDHFAQPNGDPNQPAPTFDVTAELQVCGTSSDPLNSTALGMPTDEGGPQFTAPTFEQLAGRTLSIDMTGAQSATSTAAPNGHAAASDPVLNLLNNGARCVVSQAGDSAGPGVASYTSANLNRAATMIGATQVTVDFSATGTVTQMDARMYDVFPDGQAVMVDRGPRRVTPAESASGRVSFELHGNGWRFEPGHRVRIELAQDDDPYLHRSDASPSTADISHVRLDIPTRGGGRCSNLFRGSPKSDKIKGTRRSDKILARGGRDRIKARAGSDCAYGQAGKDMIKGGKGKDRLFGGRGKDRLLGGKGRDRIVARDGRRDVVRCGKGRDRAVVDRRDRVIACEKVKRPHQ